MRPSAADILVAIAKAELGEWIDPSDETLSGVWECVLYDEHGAKVGDGHAFTAAEAMALA